ncbi:MAG: MBL fold metallo-hydrolase [Bacteroidales bacterium]|nr:MBL fold metallo-hydrolase [Bacteroidales bacterium]
MDLFEIKLNNETRLDVYRSVYTPVNSNMFIIIRGEEALIIDPNINEEVIDLLHKHNVNEVYILLSHEHYDHTSGVLWLQSLFDTKLICNRICAEIVAQQKYNNPMLVALVLADKDKQDGGNRYAEFKKSFKPYTLKADKIYDTPCVFQLMGMTFKGSQTPGHSPGSWCLVVDDAFVITGDTLIKDTPVVIRFIESREQDYRNIAIPYLKSLNPELMVLPGHFDPFILKDNNILHTYNV